MANPTTNYGFVLPTPTDLVTDLPADFDIALQGVDTRLKALQPGTTSGDLAYSSATANTNVRLGIGTAGQVLAVVSGVPAWTTTADVTPLTTKGDLFTFTTVDARQAVGTNFAFLQADSAQSTGLVWNNAAFVAYTPTVTSGGGTLTTASVTGKSQRVGKICVVKIAVTITLAGTGTGTIGVTLPFTSANDGDTFAAGVFRENNVTGLAGIGRVTPNSTNCLISQTKDTTFIADGRKIVGTITYEVA